MRNLALSISDLLVVTAALWTNKMATMLEKKMQERMRELQKANKACFNCATLVSSRNLCNYPDTDPAIYSVHRARHTWFPRMAYSFAQNAVESSE